MEFFRKAFKRRSSKPEALKWTKRTSQFQKFKQHARHTFLRKMGFTCKCSKCEMERTLPMLHLIVKTEMVADQSSYSSRKPNYLTVQDTDDHHPLRVPSVRSSPTDILSEH